MIILLISVDIFDKQTSLIRTILSKEVNYTFTAIYFTD